MKDRIPSLRAFSSHPHTSSESEHLLGKEAANELLAINSYIIRTIPFHIGMVISSKLREGVPFSLSEKNLIIKIE